LDLTFSTKQISEETGLSRDTLRYYEKIQLIPPIERSKSGHRVYDLKHKEIINLIVCLKKTGMSLDAITKYIKLNTSSERYEMLQEHKKKVESQVTELQKIIELKLKKIGK